MIPKLIDTTANRCNALTYIPRQKFLHANISYLTIRFTQTNGLVFSFNRNFRFNSIAEFHQRLKKILFYCNHQNAKLNKILTNANHFVTPCHLPLNLSRLVYTEWLNTR